MKKQLLSSSLYRFLENLITVVTSLALTPFLINTLGNNDYGLWILIISIMGWFNVVNLGFPVAVQRHITFALEQNDTKQINVVFSTSLVLFGGLGLIAALGLISLAQFPLSLGVDPEAGVTLTFALSILCLKVVWDFLMNAFHGFFSGLLRFDIDANISSVNAVVKAILVFTLVSDMQIMGAVIATLAADFLTNIIKIYYVRKLHPPLRFDLKLVSKGEFKSLFSFSKYVVAGGIAKTISSKADPILVTKLFDLSVVPIYAIASRLSGLLEGFAFSVTGVFQPVFTKLVARGGNIEATFRQITMVNIFVYSTLYLFLLTFGELFVSLWVGEAFSDSIIIIYILVFSYICRSISCSVRDVLYAQANHKLMSILSLFTAIFNVLLSIFFAQFWGLEGIAIGTAIGFFISDVLVNLYLLKHYNNYNLLPIIKRFLLAIITTYSIGMMGQFLIKTYIATSWMNLFLIASITAPLFVLISGLLLLDNNTKKQVIRMFSKKLTKN